jgi:preprotein translocase subunit SecY
MNPAGVIPVIFAIALLILPQTLASYWNNAVLHNIAAAIAFGQPLNLVLQFGLVVAFTFFYTFIVFKPDDVADNLKKYGGFIPGIRPGKPTAEYLTRVASRLVVMGALFLGIIAIMPTLMVGLTNIPNIYFGGTALLIVVMVTVETIKQIQAQLVMRNYQGFLR